jgi:CRISPR-associated endonuclease Cas1/CRISPR-associated protein Cas4
MTDLAQPELPLPAPPLPAGVPLLPARMVNEHVYCPRLAYLMWVQGEWADTADTVEGRIRHRRVEGEPSALPPAAELPEDEQLVVRSLTLASERLGLIARLDLLEVEDGAVTPVDIKRGRRPHVDKAAHEPERVQLCVQALILEEHGYRVGDGLLYFAESRERVRVVFDEELRALTMAAIDGLRLTALGGRIPPPLEDSPKCPRCALVGICLPDEINYLKGGEVSPRPIAVARDEALPVYVQAQRARVSKEAETLVIEVEGESTTRARLIDTSSLVLMGNVSITTPCLHELMRREIPVAFHSYAGWFLGLVAGVGHKNVELRTAQYRASLDATACLRLARGLVHAKIRNCRTLLRRNWRGPEPPERLLADLKREAAKALTARSLGELLGIEGNAAALYFGAFAMLLRRDGDEPAFDLTRRNRRPPADPVNALLSFAYAVLTRTLTVRLAMVGLDPYRGFYHQPRYGRPALALDLMEPFRPLVADSVSLTLVNNGEVQPSDFVERMGAVNLTREGRAKVLLAVERRLAQEVAHPVFGYRVSYRRVFEIEARLLSRHLLGELPTYEPLVTR